MREQRNSIDAEDRTLRDDIRSAECRATDGRDGQIASYFSVAILALMRHFCKPF